LGGVESGNEAPGGGEVQIIDYGFYRGDGADEDEKEHEVVEATTRTLVTMTMRIMN
jgi:hypothetical protein